MEKLKLKIKGMHCTACAKNIEINLKGKEGVISVGVNYAIEKAIVEYEEEKISEKEVEKVIVDAGYIIAKQSSNDDEADKKMIKSQKIKAIIAVILALPIAIRMFWMWEVVGSIWGISITDWIQHDITFVIVFFIGWQFHKNAYKELKKFQFSMDSLISLGTLTAYFFSVWSLFDGGHLYFESAASITALILLGKYFEATTKGKASQAMRKLMELGVKKAKVIGDDGVEVEKDIEKIQIGEIIVIRPSEKMPLDGVVIEGESNIDESMLTGESLPVAKKKNDKVFGATINQDGILKIKVTQIGEDTILSQIIKTVEDAQSFKAPIQKLADKIAGIFVPTVITIAFLTFLGWILVGSVVSVAIINAVAVLIIACPCALGIATPIAVMVGTSVGAKNGILIKGGESFEKTKDIDVIIFDKTGTLTEGKPKVQEVMTNNFEEEKAIKLAGSLANNSEHPISKAVSALVKEKKLNLEEDKLDNFKEITGRGVSGICKKHDAKLFLGNRRLMEENNMNMKWIDKILDENKESGGTVLFISHKEVVIGAFLIADKIRANAKRTIDEVKKIGIEPIMISGDNKDTARAVASQLGIENFLAEVLPNEKQDEVKKLQKANKKVVFVGDGINDAPSLVQADLGIAMGSGTDIAKEAGDIIIIKSDPIRIVEAIKLSQKTFAVIKQNLFWAFFYNVLAIPLAISGLVNPMVAAVAMSFSSISVIGNSLRMYKK